MWNNPNIQYQVALNKILKSSDSEAGKTQNVYLFLQRFGKNIDKAYNTLSKDLSETDQQIVKNAYEAIKNPSVTNTIGLIDVPAKALRIVSAAIAVHFIPDILESSGLNIVLKVGVGIAVAEAAHYAYKRLMYSDKSITEPQTALSPK